MDSFCPDASSVIPRLLPVCSSRRVRRFWAGFPDAESVAPPLLFAEVTPVTRRYVHASTVLPDEAAVAVEDLLRLAIQIVHARRMYRNALNMAQRLGQRRAYDVQYLAVAKMENCPIVTVDRALHTSAAAPGIQSRHLQ